MTDRELAGCALLPCPFCGLTAGMVSASRGTGFYACCTGGNGCQASQFAMTESEAIAAWNRRTHSSEGDAQEYQPALNPAGTAIENGVAPLLSVDCCPDPSPEVAG